MKRLFTLASMMLTLIFVAHAQEFKTYENKAFSIDYPSNWYVSWDGNTFVNISTEDDEIRFSCSFNEEGPMKSQLKEAVDNWVYMKEQNGAKVDQKMVKDDYALVRSILIDEEDGSKTVEVWYIMISCEPQGFSGTIECPFERANEAIDVLVAMLATLSPK